VQRLWEGLVDVLVNNTGRGLYGDFIDQPLQKILGLHGHDVGDVCALTEMTYRSSGNPAGKPSLPDYHGGWNTQCRRCAN
jgi:hypothetical protein